MTSRPDGVAPTRRGAVAPLLLLLHLILVTAGAAGLPPHIHDAVDPLLAAATFAAGSDNGFGFYAPRVSPPTRLRFVDDDPTTPEIMALPSGLGLGESQLRFNTAYDSMRMESEPYRRAVSASLAAMWFGQHPEVGVVTVELEFIDIPPLNEARGGEVPSKWLPLYSATFSRSGT